MCTYKKRRKPKVKPLLHLTFCSYTLYNIRNLNVSDTSCHLIENNLQETAIEYIKQLFGYQKIESCNCYFFFLK